MDSNKHASMCNSHRTLEATERILIALNVMSVRLASPQLETP